MRKIPIKILVMTKCVFFGETSGCFSLQNWTIYFHSNVTKGKLLVFPEVFPTDHYYKNVKKSNENQLKKGKNTPKTTITYPHQEKDKENLWKIAFQMCSHKKFHNNSKRCWLSSFLEKLTFWTETQLKKLFGENFPK